MHLLHVTSDWQSCIILTSECSHFPSSISQCEWMVAKRGMGWWIDGELEGGTPPFALFYSHLLPHSRPEVVGVLLTCNPSQCLAAGSWVTCHSVWHESALTPADLSCFSKPVNRAWVCGPQAKEKLKYPPIISYPQTTGCCQMTQKSVRELALEYG